LEPRRREGREEGHKFSAAPVNQDQELKPFLTRIARITRFFCLRQESEGQVKGGLDRIYRMDGIIKICFGCPDGSQYEIIAFGKFKIFSGNFKYTVDPVKKGLKSSKQYQIGCY
jgi:hypothetical protein